MTSVEPVRSRDYRAIRFCRLCSHNELTPLWDLGEQYIMGYPPLSYPRDYGVKAPLRLWMCCQCKLVQLEHTVDRDKLYEHYYYRSGISGTMRNALQEVVDHARRSANLLPGDAVADIGCNDGTLLDLYPPSAVTIGVDPSDIARQTVHARHTFVNHYFSVDSLKRAYPNVRLGTWKIITSVAMFYDVPRPLDFMADIADMLHEEGVWVNQMNYTPMAMNNLAVDFISHEHLTYWTIQTLEWGLEHAGLEIFDIDLLPLNGGTARFYIQHRGARPIIHKDKVDKLRHDELEYNSPQAWQAFHEKVDRNGSVLRGILGRARSQEKVVAVYGASTRGNSLLQYYDLDVKQLPYAADRDPQKWGKKMVGTNIPIVSEEEARSCKPDYFLVLPYSYIEEFKVREKEFLDRGGKFIVPLPKAEVVS